MVAAERDLRRAAAVVIGGTDAQADPWVAGQRTQVTHDGRRPEGATELRKARREVGHLDDAILVVVEAGHQHGGIAAIGLLGALEILELDIVEAALCILVAVEQAAEHGIAVEAGQAAPPNASLGIDKSAEGAVADNRQSERTQPATHAPEPSLQR